MLWVIREDVDVKDEKPRGGGVCCEILLRVFDARRKVYLWKKLNSFLAWLENPWCVYTQTTCVCVCTGLHINTFLRHGDSYNVPSSARHFLLKGSPPFFFLVPYYLCLCDMRYSLASIYPVFSLSLPSTPFISVAFLNISLIFLIQKREKRNGPFVLRP